MKKTKHNIIESNNHINLCDIRDFLPLGSIVKLTATEDKKYLIFGISPKDPTHQERTFDYIAVGYPDGNLIDETTTYFNHNEISKVIHMGYVDEEYQEYIDMIASCQNLLGGM